MLRPQPSKGNHCKGFFFFSLNMDYIDIGREIGPLQKIKLEVIQGLYKRSTSNNKRVCRHTVSQKMNLQIDQIRGEIKNHFFLLQRDDEANEDDQKRHRIEVCPPSPHSELLEKHLYLLESSLLTLSSSQSFPKKTEVLKFEN